MQKYRLYLKRVQGVQPGSRGGGGGGSGAVPSISQLEHQAPDSGGQHSLFDQVRAHSTSVP